jgi:hypothetical protein
MVDEKARLSAETILLLARASEQGLTVDATAKAIGVSRRSVYRWMRQESVPIPALLNALRALVESPRD